jgi:hypothetical protein
MTISKDWMRPAVALIAFSCLLAGPALAQKTPTTPTAPPPGQPFQNLQTQIDTLRGTVASMAVLGPKSARDLVVLRTSGLANCATSGNGGKKFDQRMMPDGTTVSFTSVPTGKMLVLTGVAWRTTGTQQGTVNGFTLRLEPPGTTANVFFDSVVSGNGMSGSSAPFPGPIAVAPNVGICGLSNAGQGGLLYGYLVDDR